MNKIEKIFYIFISLCIPVGIIFLINRPVEQWTQRENIFLTLALSISSGITSWIIASVFSENQVQETRREYEKNLKLYALKASEKVENLSSEFDRLAVYLQNELDSDENNPLELELLKKEERIQSAIHIISTLKSINDNSLSDWQGIIPKELEEKREAKEKNRQVLSDVINEFESLSAYSLDDESLKSKIEELNKKIDAIIPVAGLAIPKRKSNREKITTSCPVCGEEIVYSQRPKRGSSKSIQCGSCNTIIISKWSKENGFTQEVKTKPGISEELIEQIKDMLPEQPWSKGTSKKIASEMKINESLVRRAVSILMDRGDLKYQRNGALFDSKDAMIEEINKELSGVA